MGKQDLLLELIRETVVMNPDWKAPIPLIFDLAKKQNIYTSKRYFKEAVQSLQTSGFIEVNGSEIIVPSGRLML